MSTDSYLFIDPCYIPDVDLEGALKGQAFTDEHAEGFAVGELKHGTLALVTEDTPVLANVQLQLAAYHTAAKLGRSIDKPRNVAKSVTVE